ncbi:hypothetical protein KP509_05G072100 [Ceratopteris richardii]|uniref:Uncharacterized protein n=1 Tax=Ceratopteris richardii TaxID=49495 RepID=A0A8T2US31_CERRI|nr:hypothetical protein KP509_05G072100 [Ceratopteris richardii]KAH7437438.1 hypothetical protein KP509_05G072100 [Ceratopteris richardii]KAH7437439.1 hypothetical protein KP509_05G072100 [Ceratopteris richardii]KAH7437440.1 hypothetical protein KP509_05G072100 [Ceratopteris richardii]KAH7437441.1 hypothetical protein KP509_05G072100 [Ceratopteris richardii]
MWKTYHLSTPSNTQLDEMIFEGDDCGYRAHASVAQSEESFIPEGILQKPMLPNINSESIYEDRIPDSLIHSNLDGSVKMQGDADSRVEMLKLEHPQVERDVFGLQSDLRHDLDMHNALEEALRSEGCPSAFSNLPVHAKKLVSEVIMLEMAISSLEKQIASLNMQVSYELRERYLAERILEEFPYHGQELKSRDSTCNQMCFKQSTHIISSNKLPNAGSPRLSNMSSSLTNACSGQPLRNFTCSPGQNLLQEFPARLEAGSRSDCLDVNHRAGCNHLMQQSGFLIPQEIHTPLTVADPKSCLSPFRGMSTGIMQPVHSKNSWCKPNMLSEEMVKCMVNIYRHLSNSIDGRPSCTKIASPTSPYGNTSYSSVSSTSGSSSATHSPPLASRRKDLLSEKSFDPYKLSEKIPWSNIGAYENAVEVSEMSVGKEQLDYAAEALRTFRSLVEQLSRVDPGKMKHNEKLAFWINVYNALMMHAYLAYGVPKNDFKFFSLMQKAAYTIGGHSFNAIVIEHLLLKVKAQWYRPQIALLLTHQKLTLREEVSMFAIDQAEPLVAFSLSFGAMSCPAVRMYTANNIYQELQSALQDYVRASVGLSTRGKLLIPKLLNDFGLDIIQESKLLDWICQFLPSEQSKLVYNCITHRQRKSHNSKHLSVLPFDFHFRYLFLLQCNP